jgi:regulator of sigma E protease
MPTTLIAGLFVLGVVILVHEFGHFIVAKMFGVYVRTFSLGFGKKILRHRKGETEYAISVLPLGGYVKFAGEMEYYDEVDHEKAEEGKQEERKPGDEIPDSEIPRERYFTTQPRPVRAAVLFAGPFMNYVLAVVLYIGVTWVQGVSLHPTTTIGEVVAGSAADSAGLHAGDRIVSVDGTDVSYWEDVLIALRDGEGAERRFVVEREGLPLEIACAGKPENGVYRYGIGPLIPAKIGRVKRGEPAHRAGIREGAVIESINDTTITTWYEMHRIVRVNPETALYVRWTQDGVTHADSVVPKAKKELKAGSMKEFEVVGVIGLSQYVEQRRESLPVAIQTGFGEANQMIVRIVTFLGKYFTREVGVETLGGPILITQMAGDVARWGFDYLLVWLAFLSINLCIFNLLPLLPFDGGHLVLLAWESVTRRPVNRRVREILAQAGFVLIILLMAFVLLLDLNRCTGSSPGLF